MMKFILTLEDGERGDRVEITNFDETLLHPDKRSELIAALAPAFDGLARSVGAYDPMKDLRARLEAAGLGGVAESVQSAVDDDKRDSLWREVARQLFNDAPALDRRDLSNNFATMLRPRGLPWFRVPEGLFKVPDEDG